MRGAKRTNEDQHEGFYEYKGSIREHWREAWKHTGSARYLWHTDSRLLEGRQSRDIRLQIRRREERKRVRHRRQIQSPSENARNLNVAKSKLTRFSPIIIPLGSKSRSPAFFPITLGYEHLYWAKN